MMRKAALIRRPSMWHIVEARVRQTEKKSLMPQHHKLACSRAGIPEDHYQQIMTDLEAQRNSLLCWPALRVKIRPEDMLLLN